jgi:hypothetical protein
VISIARRLQFRCELHRGDLAIAFFQWAGHADGGLEFAKLDPIDYAHYACGVLLGSLIHAHPISIVDRESAPGDIDQPRREQMNWPEDQVILRITLTFLEAWRLHLGAAPLVINMELIKDHWDSFHENAREDSSSPVPFLDMLLGLPPVWENPMNVGDRLAMRLAHDKRHADLPRTS